MGLGFPHFLAFNQNSKSWSRGQPPASQSSLARALIASLTVSRQAALQVLLQLLNKLLEALIGSLVADNRSEPVCTLDFAFQFLGIFNLTGRHQFCKTACQKLFIST